jgi:hypothetical protein
VFTITMANYNIIYKAEDGQHYLWNGGGFDFFMKEKNEKLLFSGKTFGDKELAKALKKCRQAAKLSFPSDKHPKIESIPITVNARDDQQGHSAHITS